MEPLSSFGISIAAGIVCNLISKPKGIVKEELNLAFNSAIIEWCPNGKIRDRKKNEIRSSIEYLIRNPKEIDNYFENGESELETFFLVYKDHLAKYNAAYNYFKEIKDLERFKKELAFLKNINEIVINNNFKLDKILIQQDSILKTINSNNQIQIERIEIRCPIFNKELDNFKNNKRYLEALDFVGIKFISQPSWELAIEFLKFSDLASKPELGVVKFRDFRKRLNGKVLENNKLINYAINYYLGRLNTQLGNYQEAFSWHNNNDILEFTSYLQILSRFEIASLNFHIENYKFALNKFESLFEITSNLEDMENLKIHINLYLATLHIINVIHNVPNSVHHSYLINNPKKSLEHLSFAVNAINKLDFKDDRDDKLAWCILLIALCEDIKGNNQKSKNDIEKVKKIILDDNITESSSIHILMYLSRYYRKKEEYNNAIDTIKVIKSFSISNRNKIKFSVNEEISYILEKCDKKAIAKKFFIAAIEAFRKEPFIQDKVHWPLVERLSKTCDEFDIDFNI